MWARASRALSTIFCLRIAFVLINDLFNMNRLLNTLFADENCPDKLRLAYYLLSKEVDSPEVRLYYI